MTWFIMCCAASSGLPWLISSSNKLGCTHRKKECLIISLLWIDGFPPLASIGIRNALYVFIVMNQKPYGNKKRPYCFCHMKYFFIAQRII